MRFMPIVLKGNCLFSMAKLNSAKNFFERTRIKGSENNKDISDEKKSKKNYRRQRSVVIVGP